MTLTPDDLPQRNFDPFAEVSGRYGAPMGRHGHGSYDPAMGALYEAHQGGEAGYDKGGAYWGVPRATCTLCGQAGTPQQASRNF